MSGTSEGGHGTRALVVYESMFGNTKQVAEAIADALRARVDVGIFEVAQAPDLIDDGVELLVIAAPTHAFSMSRRGTRRDAAARGGTAIISSGRGVREWIDEVRSSGTVRFAAVDTKVRKPLLPGSAAKAAAKRLRNKGWIEVTGPTSFFVDGLTGPMLDGELERAAHWATQLTVGAATRA